MVKSDFAGVIELRILRSGADPAPSRWARCTHTRVLISERGRQLSQGEINEKEAEVGLLQGHEPNDAGDFERVGSKATGSLLNPHEECSPAHSRFQPVRPLVGPLEL